MSRTYANVSCDTVAGVSPALCCTRRQDVSAGPLSALVSTTPRASGEHLDHKSFLQILSALFFTRVHGTGQGGTRKSAVNKLSEIHPRVCPAVECRLVNDVTGGLELFHILKNVATTRGF